jgi:hypothetical protein
MIKVVKRVGGEKYSHGPMDFNWCDDGELLVMFGGCDNGRECGCAQAFTGLDSRKGTTRGVVVELDMTEEDFAARIHASKLFEGWSLDFEDANAVADHLLNQVEPLDAGTIVGIADHDRVFVIGVRHA